jgi:hypothetical protein
MEQLEENARPILEALWSSRSPSPTGLSSEQCDILARWTFKTSAALNYSVDYKKIIPLEQIHQFYISGHLPENATVNLAFCHRVGIRWILGGNKKYVFQSKRITDTQKRETYVITLQFYRLLLRLAWVPVDGIRAAAIPSSAVFRIFPQDKPVQVVRRHIFRDLPQFHFTATILAEEVFSDNLTARGM